MNTKPILKPVTLGVSQRRVRTFGAPELVSVISDGRTISYKVVSDEYLRILSTKTSFSPERMRAFDFKLPRATGKRWPEAPRLNGNIEFQHPQSGETLCTGTVTFTNLLRKRSTGIMYVMDFTWVHDIITDFTDFTQPNEAYTS